MKVASDSYYQVGQTGTIHNVIYNITTHNALNGLENTDASPSISISTTNTTIQQ